MTEPASASTITTSGRVVRAALIIFPFGTVVLGIASFGFWWVKKEKVADRSYLYAAALRRDMTEKAIDRYLAILHDVRALPDAESLPSIASYVESSMSSENMGYEPKRDRFFSGRQEVSNVIAEMAGTQRPREVKLVLVCYGDKARQDAESHALAGMMALAHAMAGERAEHTLRFIAVPLGVKDPSGRTALERVNVAMADRSERLMQVIVLGGPEEALLSEISLAFRVAQTGAVVLALPETTDSAGTLAAMTVLKSKL